MNPALNGSSAIQHFEGSDGNKIRDGITFGFYTGLSHIHVLHVCTCTVDIKKHFTVVVLIYA